ncbi:MAG: DUF6468 domain-containing protein [Proteobacteria bacterium]|nr:DUF6468 domain-containing protein [Pseudomonadota bacterium]
MQLGLWLDGLVAILLLITVGYCLVLNRRLTALRGYRVEMQQLLSNFTEATRQAESSVSYLKIASDQIGSTLDQRMTEARALADELSSMNQSGSRLADRIEKGLVGRSGLSQETAPSGDRRDAPAKLSESERELAEILRQAR